MDEFLSSLIERELHQISKNGSNAGREYLINQLSNDIDIIMYSLCSAIDVSPQALRARLNQAQAQSGAIR